MIQTVTWKSKKELPCDRCPPVAAILCVNSALIAQKSCPIDPLAEPEITAETDYPWQTILGVVVSVTTMGEGCHKWFLFTATYDDSQLLPGTTLDPKDIHGVICDDVCLTAWVREQVGYDVKLELDEDDPNTLILTNQHGCKFSFTPGSPADNACALQTQEDHGFTLPAYGVLPIRYDDELPGYVLAQADSSEDAADLLVIGVPSSDTFLLAEHDGLIEVPSHGLTVGNWYVVDPDVAGNLISQDELEEDDLLQRALFVVSPSCLYLSLEAAETSGGGGGGDLTIVDNEDGTFDFFQDGVFISSIDACLYCSGGGGPLAPIVLTEAFDNGGVCGVTAAWVVDSFDASLYAAYTPPQSHYSTVVGPSGNMICARNNPSYANGAPYQLYSNHLQAGLPLGCRKLYMVEQSFLDPDGGGGMISGEYNQILLAQGISPNSTIVALFNHSNTVLTLTIVDQVTSGTLLLQDITIPDCRNVWHKYGVYVQLNSTPVTADGFVQVYLNGGPTNPNPIYDTGPMILTTGTGDLTLVDVGQQNRWFGGNLGGQYKRYVPSVTILNGTPNVTQL